MLQKIIFISLFIISLNSEAQKQPKIAGDWLLTKIVTKDASQKIGQLVTFNKEGNFLIQNIPFGTWQYKPKESQVIIQAKNLSGNYKISHFSADNMQLTQKDKDLFFSKINKEQILKNNAASGLIGLWEFRLDNNDQTHRIIQFELPDKVRLIEKDANMESRHSGIWLYLAQKKQLVIIGQMKGIRGINNQVNIRENEVAFLNKTPIVLKKVKQADSIEHLSFSEDDFYTEEGDYKYENDFQKLPWKDFYQMMDDLSNVKQLVYKQATLVNGTQSFENKILKADVKANPDNESLEIDNIFNGYDRYNLPIDTAWKRNKYTQYASKLYPYNDIIFRVVDTAKKINVPAGTFTCTLVEGLGKFEEKLKIWMINDKPGIIAKIIGEKAGNFGHYIIYELQKIELK